MSYSHRKYIKINPYFVSKKVQKKSNTNER